MRPKAYVAVLKLSKRGENKAFVSARSMCDRPWKNTERTYLADSVEGTGDRQDTLGVARDDLALTEGKIGGTELQGVESQY